MNKLIKKQSGVILLLTLLILSGILVVTLVAADLVLAGIKMNRLAGYSNLAFSAAEAGLERALWEARYNNYIYPSVDTPSVFSLDDLGNGSSYQVDFATSTPIISFTSVGAYRGVKRSVKSTYALSGELPPPCAPDCSGKVCGDDGCGGSCGSCGAEQVCISGICQEAPSQTCEFTFPMLFPWIFNCLF